MTESSNPSSLPDKSEGSVEKPQGTGVGYKRPPKHGQFRKNQSGNPKGRKPGSKNLMSQLWEVYHRPTKVRDSNGKTRTVPAIVALHEMYMVRGFQGDGRAAVIAFKFAADLGMYALPEPQVIRHEFGFTRDHLREMSSKTIGALIEAHKLGLSELEKNGIKLPE